MSLNNVHFSAGAPYPGRGTKSGRGLILLFKSRENFGLYLRVVQESAVMTSQMEGYKASNPAATGLIVLIEKDSCR